MMKPYRIYIVSRVFLAAALLFSLTAVADDLDGVLAKFPGKSEGETQIACAALLAQEDAALAALCDRIQPDSAGGADVTVRYAVSGLTKYVMTPDHAADRLRLEQVYLAALQRANDTSVRFFLVLQLEWIASEASVPAMGALLNTPELMESAAMALENVKGEAAGKALFEALSSVPPACRPRIVKALGDLAYAPAKSALLAMLSDSDAALAAEARSALAGLGAREVESTLLTDFNRAADGAGRGVALGNLLRLRQRLIAQGDTEGAEALSRNLLELKDTSTRVAGLEGLVTIKGEKAVADLTAAMADPDAVYRGAALRLAARIDGAEATKAWTKAFEKASPEARVQIIAMLATRRDNASRKAVAEAVEEDDATVRMAALQTMDGKAASYTVKPLIELIEKSDDAKERAAAAEAALLAPGDEVVDRAAKALRRAKPDAQQAFMDILAARKAGDKMDVVADLLNTDDAGVQAKALMTLAAAGTPEQWAPVYTLLKKAENDGVEKAAIDTLVAIKAHTVETGSITDSLAVVGDDFGKSEEAARLRLIRLIARLGDAALMQRVITEVIANEGCAEALRTEAIAQIADNAPVAYPDFCRLAATLTSGAVRDAVLSGMNRIVVRSEDEAAVPQYVGSALEQKALKNVAEKEAFIDAVSRHRTGEALKSVVVFLEDPETVAAAVKAMAAIGCKKSDRDKGLSDADSLALLEKARDLAVDAAVKEQLTQHITAARQPVTP